MFESLIAAFLLGLAVGITATLLAVRQLVRETRAELTKAENHTALAEGMVALLLRWSKLRPAQPDLRVVRK